jgi:magnesium transporter
MSNPLLLPELRIMLDENDEPGLAAVFSELHPASIADFSEGLSTEETWRLLERASVAAQADVFTYFPMAKQLNLAEGRGHERMAKLLEEMAPDNRVDLLQRLEPEVVDGLLPLVAKAERQDIRLLLSCPEGSAGSVMTTEYASLRADMTVESAIAQLRKQAPETETIYYVYVLDEHRHLLGFVSLRDLILAKPDALVGDIMQREVVSVRVDADREHVAHELARYDFLAIPVVDDQNRLTGIVTHDDIIDVVVEEATKDVHQMGAVGALIESHLDAPFLTVWRKRSIWLSCLFIAELCTFSAMAHFEHAIASVVVLSFFVPLCISTGGNSGSQAATLITRAMALEQVQPAEWWRVVKHELLMGIALGLTLGAIAFTQAALTPQSVLGDVNRWMLAFVISQSVTVICLWGTLVGSLLPLGFRQLGIDPGYASSPFVATFVDVTGIVIYLSIATVYLL